LPAPGVGDAGSAAGDGEHDGDDAEPRDADMPLTQVMVGEQPVQRQLAFLSQI